MAAHSKPIKFQDDMCMCADKNKPNQTTAAFSKLHGLCFKAGFKLSFMQHLIGGFSRFFLLSGRNYNTRVQKEPIQQWVTEQRELSFDSYRDKSSHCHSITQPHIPD